MVAEIGCLTNPFPSFWSYCQIVSSACLVLICRLRSSQRDQEEVMRATSSGLPCSFHGCYLNAEDCRILGEGNMEKA